MRYKTLCLVIAFLNLRLIVINQSKKRKRRHQRANPNILAQRFSFYHFLSHTNLHYKFLYQPALIDRSLDKRNKQRVRVKRLGFQFRMKLDSNKPRMIGNLDNFRQLAIRRHP